MDLAVEYYEKAAKLNNVQALLNLGIIYEDSNKSKALQYF
jgi:TPR repeat protein